MSYCASGCYRQLRSRVYASAKGFPSTLYLNLSTFMLQTSLRVARAASLECHKCSKAIPAQQKPFRSYGWEKAIPFGWQVTKDMPSQIKKEPKTWLLRALGSHIAFTGIALSAGICQPCSNSKLCFTSSFTNEPKGRHKILSC